MIERTMPSRNNREAKPLDLRLFASLNAQSTRIMRSNAIASQSFVMAGLCQGKNDVLYAKTVTSKGRGAVEITAQTLRPGSHRATE